MLMETKKITVPLLPTNKTQKRLYCASLDSTFEHDTLNDLQNYVNTDPTAYLGQILYCKENDTIYRIAKGGDGVGKIIKESGQKGDKGDTGERGPKGDIGPVGPQGPKGDTPDMTEYNNRLDEIDEHMLVFDFIDEEGVTPPPVSGLYDDTELKNQIKTINTELTDARNGEQKLGNTIRKINERINNLNGVVGPQGPKGDKGETGPQGPPGRDGATPDMSGFESRITSQYETIKAKVDKIEQEDTPVVIPIVGNKITLTTAKRQKATMENNTTIELPDVNKFTEIHLTFSITEVLTIILPNIKWQGNISIEANKTYEFIFTYDDGWMGGCIVYEQEVINE